MDCINKKDFSSTLLIKDIKTLIYDIRCFFFPGYFEKINESIEEYTDLKKQSIKNQLIYLFKIVDIDGGVADDFLDTLPSIQRIIKTDIEATYDGDPAAKSYDEIIITYPGIYAISIYRTAHVLYKLGVPLIPRMMTEVAHSKTGIDINPGAEIGEYFFIDHGTGVVIGETSVIGKHVRIYQGVTLGALSLKEGHKLQNTKRHPTVGDNVIIYSGSCILGGKTFIGNNVTIGSNVFITESVPDDVTVVSEKPKLVYKSKIQ